MNESEKTDQVRVVWFFKYMTEGKIVGLYYFFLKFEQFLNNISAVLGLFWMLEGKLFFKSEFFCIMFQHM